MTKYASLIYLILLLLMMRRGGCGGGVGDCCGPLGLVVAHTRSLEQARAKMNECQVERLEE